MAACPRAPAFADPIHKSLGRWFLRSPGGQPSVSLSLRDKSREDDSYLAVRTDQPSTCHERKGKQPVWSSWEESQRGGHRPLSPAHDSSVSLEDAPARLLRAFRAGARQFDALRLRRGLPLEDGASSPQDPRPARHPTRVFPFLSCPARAPAPAPASGAAPPRVSARPCATRQRRATSRSAPSPEGSPRSLRPKQPPPPPALPAVRRALVCAVARRDDVNAPYWLPGPRRLAAPAQGVTLNAAERPAIGWRPASPSRREIRGRQASGDQGAAAGRAERLQAWERAFRRQSGGGRARCGLPVGGELEGTASA